MQSSGKSLCFTVDVEEWFHVLDSPATPNVKHWQDLESRIERSLDELLAILDSVSGTCTFFWLAWLAERHKKLVRKCHDMGHEIASHGYAHELISQSRRQQCTRDVARSKTILEDIIGQPVRGFRAPGFSATNNCSWVFNEINKSGFLYDASIFPAAHSHGGMPNATMSPHFINTQSGYLFEFPISVTEIFGRRVCFFGGGYLRLAPKQVIRWGLERLIASGQPPAIYLHPREIDPSHPRLPLSLGRRFKCYVGLKSTLSKLEWMFDHYQPRSMLECIQDYIQPFFEKTRPLPTTEPEAGVGLVSVEHKHRPEVNADHHEPMHAPFPEMEKAMRALLGCRNGRVTGNNDMSQESTVVDVNSPQSSQDISIVRDLPQDEFGSSFLC